MASLMLAPLHAQSRREMKKQKEAEEFAETLKLVESGSFHFLALRALSSRGRTIDLATHHATAGISNETATADLPYFGRATASVGYSPESGGIKFDGPMEGVNLSVNEKKNRINLSFTVRGGRDQFKCIYTIMASGSATLGITSNTRESISYDGRISAVIE